MRYFRDLTGMRIGKLTVISKIEREPIKGGNISFHWLCKCDCGKECIVLSNSLSRKKKPTISCGCSRQDIGDLMRGKPSKHRLSEGEACLNNLMYSYIKGAKKRNLSFELTKAEFTKLTKQNCYYCGCPPSQTFKTTTTYSSYTYNGIDRADNENGYTNSNSRACCKHCNRAKLAMKEVDFFELVRKIAKLHKLS